MNIGIFTDTYSPQINGVVTSTATLAKELSRLGHNVVVFTGKDPNAEPSPMVVRLPSFPVKVLGAYRFVFYYPPKLITHLKTLKLDIIHTQTEFAMGFLGALLADFYKIPHVHTYHTMYEDYLHYFLNGHFVTPKTAARYSRFFCNGANMVIAPVEKTQKSLVEYKIKRPIRVVPTGFDFGHFSANPPEEEIAAIRRELGIDGAPNVLAAICRVAKEKSLDVIIRAMPELAGRLEREGRGAARLVIVGDGPYKADLMELCRAEGVERLVVFAGARSFAEIPKYYKLGVFVSASTSETQGLTYVEAMAAGAAVAAKSDPSIDGVVIDGVTGYTFKKDNECAEVLYKALTASAEETERIKKNALKRIESLSLENFANSVLEVYGEAEEINRNRKSRLYLRKLFVRNRFVVNLSPKLKKIRFKSNRIKKAKK
ncbi:MAG: glycosyltransferase [Clostridiales bacterium]|jgi:1,2-diacylglycerol 3-alpha-glucosyltransferase|nr:glycosyltransferase [Clostridiales bacterium]